MDDTQITAEDRKIISGQLSIMPDHIKDVFKQRMIQNTMAGLKEIYELSDEQALNLENELSLTFLGLELVSDLQQRAKKALQATDEKVEDILDDLTIAILTEENMNTLKQYEQFVSEAAKGEQPAGPSKATIPAAPGAKAAPAQPEAKPGITARPQPKVVPSGSQATIKQSGQTPTGKLVGLKKEQVESAVKGMRTMRGDINRLRPEGEGVAEGEAPTADASDIKKPFKGN